MVDLSNPDSDPTVRKIVAEKFFGSGTGRYHSLTFVLLCRCVLMCVDVCSCVSCLAPG